MKTINSRSKSAENRSLHSGLLSILPLLCILFLGIPKAQAQQDSMVISAGYGISSCGTDTCCMEFTMYVERTGTRWFQLVMKAPNWASDSCFNLPCITNSVSTNGVTVLTDQVLNVDISIGGQITIAIGTDSTNGWTAGT
ncbi:MAG: hypothetical protein Q8896_12420, partial [Bacteroidota bacterium]|nr:hypothetical protein [Bacteroidota bacterium]